MGFKRIKHSKKSYAQKIVSAHKKRVTNITHVKVKRVHKTK